MHRPARARAPCPMLSDRCSSHIGSALDLVGFLIAMLRPQRVHQQVARLALRGVIAARKCQRLAAATFGLMGIVFGEA